MGRTNRLPLLFASVIVLTLPLTFVALAENETASGSLREAVDHAIAKVKPALVRIHAVSTSYRDGREVKYESSGSGVIISKEGHVITNHHVAGHAARLFCTLVNREEIEAELIGTDPLADIAVIKLIPPTPRDFTFAQFGDSSAVRVGDHVMSMGSPRALSQSVTLGIVSNTEMVMPWRMGSRRLVLDGEDVGFLVRWIAHDAEIHGGNSGGPLVNLAGEIIGINEITMGLGGAIPGNLANDVARELIRDGKVRRSWLGISIRPLLKHGDIDEGILVTGVLEGSPAEKAGFQIEDVLLRLAGHDITVRFAEELPAFNRMVCDLPIGEPVEALVLRDGVQETLEVTSVEREEARPRERELKEWGIAVRNVSFVMSKEMKRDTRDGAAITSVRPGGPAGEAKPALSRGDVIVRVGDTAITEVEDLIDVTKEIIKGASEPVPVLTTFERKTALYVAVVHVGIREINDPGLEVKKAWLPVETQVITRDIANQMGQRDLTGFRITRIFRGSTADEAGLQVGDFVVALDGEKLTASAQEHYEELPTLIRNYRAGTEAELTVLRDGEQLLLPVELMRSPKLNREMRKYRDESFEFTVREITYFDKADEGWKDDQHGVLVDDVKGGGWAALGKLNSGDLIVEVDGQEMLDLETFEKTMRDIAESRPSSILLRVQRGIYTRYIELEPKWE